VYSHRRVVGFKLDSGIVLAFAARIHGESQISRHVTLSATANVLAIELKIDTGTEANEVPALDDNPKSPDPLLHDSPQNPPTKNLSARHLYISNFRKKLKPIIDWIAGPTLQLHPYHKYHLDCEVTLCNLSLSLLFIRLSLLWVAIGDNFTLE
jgi:hypothetical protein